MILGHDQTQAHLEKALAENRLHHAYLFSGLKGLGKASFAEAMLPQILGQASGPDPAQMLAAGSHPDFIRLEIEADRKTGKMRKEITREQVEELLGFLTKHAVLAQRKVVLIDAVDDLNANAANNLLKWLEEPRPNTCLLLISHRPGGLLPTIRSRCATLLFKALDQEAFGHFAQAHHLQDSEHLFALSGGVPGEALQMSDPKIGEALETLSKLIANLDRVDALKLSGQARGLMTSADMDGLVLSIRLLRYALRALAGQGADMAQARFAAEAYALTKGREALARSLNMDVVQVWASLLLDLHALARQSQAHAA